MRLDSIKFKTVAILIPLVILPILLVGIAGTLFYRDVVRQNIWDDNLAQARALSAYVDSSLNYSTLYLESLANRPLVISDLENHRSSTLNVTIQFASIRSDFGSMYVLDRTGTVVSSYPDPGLLGIDMSGRGYADRALRSSNYIGGPFGNETGEPAIYIAVTVRDNNGTGLGAVVGELDTDTLATEFYRTQVKNQQYIYMVNGTGHIIVHNNRSYMREIKDYSAVPAVQEVIQGRSGITEQYNPIEHQQRLAAYASVPGIGWGIVVAVPVDVAYRPIYEATYAFAFIMVALMIITAIIAFLLGDYIVGPILGISTATKQMIDGGDYRRYLPLQRNDEIGELARSFDTMSRRITSDKERITDEKNRAELYLDVMGHDINNLNQSALMNLELIQDDPGLTDEERKSIKGALASAKGSADIIGNVRKIQRINEEKLDVLPEDLNGLILESIRDTPRPPGKKITINYSPKPGLMIRGNPLLKEAFSNLVGNSIKYSGDEVTIDIAVDEVGRAGGRYYDVSVADNGFGIPDNIKPRLFQRFQRGTTRAYGKGLGLYIVRSLVEKLGGSARVEDRVPGDYAKGARFIVSLPALEEG